MYKTPANDILVDLSVLLLGHWWLTSRVVCACIISEIMFIYNVDLAVMFSCKHKRRPDFVYWQRLTMLMRCMFLTHRICVEEAQDSVRTPRLVGVFRFRKSKHDTPHSSSNVVFFILLQHWCVPQHNLETGLALINSSSYCITGMDVGGNMKNNVR